MNLTLLQTFLAILETGSLIRASERLNVTQSTVTARLKALEDELGQPLFHRHKSGALITEAGTKFKRYASAMTDLWRQARQETSLPPGIKTVCNIGCQIDLWPGLGECLLRAIYRDHPQTALSAWPGSSSELEGWLTTGLINAAIAYEPFAREGRSAVPLGPERLILVATRPDAPMRFDPGYVYVDVGDEVGRQHATAYADAGTAKLSFGSAVWALDHLLESGGSAYLPERLARPHLSAGTLHRIADAPEFSRPVYLITDDAAADTWAWLADVIQALQQASS